MEDLKIRVKALMYEIEYTHLKKTWVEQIIAAGIEQRDAYKWVAEIGHVIDEYERSMRFLLEMLQETSTTVVARKLESWVAYTGDITIWKLGEMIKELQGRYEKYLPPESDDDDEAG